MNSECNLMYSNIIECFTCGNEAVAVAIRQSSEVLELSSRASQYSVDFVVALRGSVCPSELIKRDLYELSKELRARACECMHAGARAMCIVLTKRICTHKTHTRSTH